ATTVTEQSFGKIKESLKRSAGAFNDADIPFLLGGGLAVWARGGPATSHDLDLIVRPADAERALDVLERLRGAPAGGARGGGCEQRVGGCGRGRAVRRASAGPGTRCPPAASSPGRTASRSTTASSIGR